MALATLPGAVRPRYSMSLSPATHAHLVAGEAYMLHGGFMPETMLDASVPRATHVPPIHNPPNRPGGQTKSPRRTLHHMCCGSVHTFRCVWSLPNSLQVYTLYKAQRGVAVGHADTLSCRYTMLHFDFCGTANSEVSAVSVTAWSCLSV